MFSHNGGPAAMFIDEIALRLSDIDSLTANDLIGWRGRRPCYGWMAKYAVSYCPASYLWQLKTLVYWLNLSSTLFDIENQTASR